MNKNSKYGNFFAETLARKASQNNDDIALQELMKKYQNKNLALIDHVIYSNKAMDASSEVEFFATDDTKARGLRNVANAKLEQDQYFCPMFLQLLAGDLATGYSDTTLKSEAYDDIFTTGGVLNNAEFTLKVNQNEYLLRESHVSEFINVAYDGRKGTKELSISSIIKPGLQMEATLKTGTATAAYLGVGFRMIGATTVPRG